MDDDNYSAIEVEVSCGLTMREILTNGDLRRAGISMGDIRAAIDGDSDAEDRILDIVWHKRGDLLSNMHVDVYIWEK